MNVIVTPKILSYFNERQFDRELVEDRYDSYFNNLTKFCKVARPELLFTDVLNFLNGANFNYLRQFNGPKFKDRILDLGYQGLAASMVKNGNYWPFFICKVKDGVYYIEEGTHRAFALQATKTSKKFLCIDVGDKAAPLTEPVTFDVIWPTKYLDHFFQRGKRYTHVEKLETDFYRCTTDNKADAYLLIVAYAIYLGKMLAPYVTDFCASPIVNDFDIFNKWKEQNSL